MIAQSILGIALHDQYRDVEWIKATWFGNDWVTLAVAVPLLLIGRLFAARGSVRGLLLWLGLLGYAIYNYAFYLLGAALNIFFPLYVFTVVLAVATLILALSHMDVGQVAARFRSAFPVRLVSGSVMVVGTGLAFVWVTIWGGYVFAGHPTPIAPEDFKLVAALDLSLMIPVLTFGGVLLWRRNPWGFVMTAMASIQASLYLVVLAVNSGIAISRRIAEPPGELPIWCALTLFTGALTLLIVGNVEPEPLRSSRSE